MLKFAVALKQTATKPARRDRWCALAGSIIAWLGKIRADRTGSVATVLALSLTAIIGFAGLGTEAASWYLTKRTMQGAADAAASTAAASLAAGTKSASALASYATGIAAQYSFTNGSNGTTVTVNYPPGSGSQKGNTGAVEVVISRQMTALLSSLFLSSGPTISARSVALANYGVTGDACVVALDTGSETSTTTSGSTNLQFPSCSLYINSPYTNALNMNGGAVIHPNIAYIAGGYSGSGLTTENGVYLGVDPLIDPYRNVTVPSFSGCDSNNYNLNAGKSETKTVGASGVYVFCNGVTLNGNASLTLGAGTFIIDRGQLTMQGGATLTATSGTTIILTTTVSSKACATTKINGGAVVALKAPSSGSLSGVAIYQDRRCSDHTLSNDLNGGGTQNITGAIYFPQQIVNYAGGASTGGAQCTQLIAWIINFTGNSTFNSTCSGIGVQKLALTGGRVVE